ncbi:MAG: RHS repeat-associated core domain-containing protein, partial [Deltaproteobacteria bacterium]|nr:RHS repeat-associated core domain-containing protein [Deltaproteobacteria bacterium]
MGDSLRRFTGKQLDPESSLYYYGGRYYDPELGRFISPDPFVARFDDPQNLNRYSYVETNPVNYTGPSGYFSFKKFFRKVFRVFNKYILPGICPVCYGISKIPAKVRGGLEIVGGIAMLLTANPYGAFFVASGATSFGRSNGWQIASGVLRGAGAVASGGGSGSDGGGNDFPV